MRKIINKTEILVILVVVILCIGALYYFNRDNGQDKIARITQNGVLIEEINLTREADTRTIILEDDVTILVEDHKIGFIDSQCPDHLCEKTGMIDKPSQTAVCLPKKTAIVIDKSDEDSIDMIAG